MREWLFDKYCIEYLWFQEESQLPVNWTITQKPEQQRKMRVVAIPIILLGYIITITTCESSYSQEYQPNSLLYDGRTDARGDSVEVVGKRSSMERRAYTYTAGAPGAKRLPNYNFGLGKRAMLVFLCFLYLIHRYHIHPLVPFKNHPQAIQLWIGQTIWWQRLCRCTIRSDLRPMEDYLSFGSR